MSIDCYIRIHRMTKLNAFIVISRHQLNYSIKMVTIYFDTRFYFHWTTNATCKKVIHNTIKVNTFVWRLWSHGKNTTFKRTNSISEVFVIFTYLEPRTRNLDKYSKNLQNKEHLRADQSQLAVVHEVDTYTSSAQLNYILGNQTIQRPCAHLAAETFERNMTFKLG